VHDYILENTPYVDIIGDKYAGEFHTTIQGKARIDYVYCTQPLYDRIVEAYVVRDDYTATNATRDEKTGFYFPSDHLPILVDFEMK
jgi:exonuclease III